MPAPFRCLDVAEFNREVNAFPWTRPILRVDMHHTFHPDHARTADIGMAAAMNGMWRAHVIDRGFDDIAQHVTIAPDGTIWTGRDWNTTPASVGYGMNANVFMMEVVGNFDVGADRLAGRQLDTTLAVVAAVQDHFRLPTFSLLFHREVPQTEKTCPGTSVSKPEILRRLFERRGTRGEGTVAPHAVRAADGLSPAASAPARDDLSGAAARLSKPARARG
jgi:N-acetylmuramoyl-L-alanine amidase